MATIPVRDVSIDHMFGIPPGLIDARHENNEDGEFNYGAETAASSVTISDPGQKIPTIDATVTNVSIVDQTIRITSDGRTVVDVTLEFPDLPNVNSVNIRETKL